MKKSLLLTMLVILSLGVASADACDLTVSLLNQDPYPAVPGEYVKLVFQVEGIDAPECNDITIELIEDYPIVFDAGEVRQKLFKKVNYVKDFQSTLMVPYEVRIADDAIDGANPIEIKVQSRGDGAVLRTFNVEVDDTIASFETHVRDYDYNTRELTIEILNIGSSDIEALTVEIPKQENVMIKGSNRMVVGDLDSNEYTSAEFEAIPKDGIINVKLLYSDSINVRRMVEEKISFDSTYFTNRIADQETTSSGTYIFYAVIIIVVIWFLYRRFKKKQKKKRKG